MPRPSRKIPGRSPRPPQSAIALLFGLVFAGSLCTAYSRPAKPTPPTPQVRAGQLVSQGVMALATRDLAGAYRALAEAYRLQPSLDTLYQLGIVAWTEGQSLMAQDILRRYLAEPGSPEGAEKRAEAQRIVSQLGRGGAEVWLSAAEGGFVFLDDRLMGQLPFSLPLLLPPGAHRLRIEPTAGPPQSIELATTAGQIVAVRAAGERLERVPLTKVILQRLALSSPAATAAPAAAEGDRRRIAARLAGLDLGLSTLNSEEPAASCGQSCLVALGQEQAADYVLRLQAEKDSDPAQLLIIDVVVGAVAVTERIASAAGTPDESWLAALPAGLQRARARGHGTLQLDTTPAGCAVRLADQPLGVTPLRRSLFVGPAELQIQCPGLPDEHRRVEIQADSPTVLALNLTPPPPPPLPPPLRRAPRPVWRLALGATALAAGLGLGGLGVSALSVAGGCIESIAPPVAACPRFYETTAAGGALLGVGAALSVSGALLLAWPGRLGRSEIAQR